MSGFAGLPYEQQPSNLPSGVRDKYDGWEYDLVCRQRDALAAEVEWLAARLEAAEATLAEAKTRHDHLQMMIDDGDDTGEHVGLQHHRRARHDGQAEILALWERSQETGDTSNSQGTGSQAGTCPDANTAEIRMEGK